MIALLITAALIMAPPPDPDALSESAKKLAVEKRYDEAATLWEKALALSPNHFPSLFNFGFMRFSLAQFAEAEPLLARACPLQPGDFNCRYLLGATLVKLGKRDAGLLAWRAALAVQPSSLKLMQIMSVEYANGYYFKEACDIGKRALALRQNEPNAYFVAIKACQDAQDPSTFDLARQAATRFPDSARANFEYGFQLQKTGRREDSLPYLKKAMSADATYEEPFFFYGNLLLQEEQYQEAIPRLQTALKNRPDYVAACVSLAKALMGLEKYEEAVGELGSCVQKSPTHPQPHLLLSQVYFRMGDEARARAEKEISLRLRRENPTIMEAPQARPFHAAQK